MQNDLTEEQILQLAPDEASVKAGKGLANRGKWVLLEHSDRAVWGHCQGSGKTPYQTVIDMSAIAFKCSCPSRKFPCKHGLGLLLLYVRQPDLFQQAEEPEWVNAWLAKREEKAERKEQKAKKETPVDEAAQAKRQAQRHQKVLDGIADLETWMKDLLRNGLINVPERAFDLFDTMSRRMVDAQAPGLAARLRNMQEIDYTQDSWKQELTDQLSKLYLLIRGYRNLEKLSAEWQDEIRTQVGYPQSQEQVLAGEAVSDRWLVLHKRSRKVNDLRTDTYWVYGEQSGRYAVILAFSVSRAVAEVNWLPGCVYQGELCFYKGAGVCRRALFRNFALNPAGFVPISYAGLEEASAHYRRAVRENPFAEDIPVLVDGVTFRLQGNWVYLADTAGFQVPLQVGEDAEIDILAITGGKPFSAFLLANAGCWELKSMWYQSEYHTWKDERD